MMEFEVGGMTCKHCIAAVTSAVKSLDANGSVSVDLRTGQVRVESSQPRDAIRAAIVEAGYSVVK
jgi:copper chaperone